MKKMKRAISLFLAVAMLLSACPISVFATTTGATEGDANLAILTYQDFQYTLLPDGTISICGYTGVPEDDSKGTYLEIPPFINNTAVTQIAEEAFADNIYIDTVAIPESVTSIGTAAFAHCEKLKGIAFYGDLPTFGSTIVKGCDALDRVLVLTGNDVDELRSLLTEDDIQADTILEYEEYESIEGLKDAYNEYVATLDAESQAVKPSLEAATPATPNEENGSTESTETPAATNPTSESTKVTEPSTQAANNIATNHSANTLSAASDFSYTVLNGTFCEITGYTGADAVVEIPSEINGYVVQSVGNNAFKDNKNLTTVVFPETVETIGTYVFSGCTALTDVSFNHGLTNIGNYTFNGCTALGSITLPSTITAIGSYAFNGCTGLSEVNMAEGLIKIYRNAFTGCSALVSIVLPDSVEYIGYEAFRNCSKLNSVNYPASWKTAGAYNTSYEGWGPDYQGRIFAGCSSLKKITIPEGVTAIPHCAFSNCTYLEEIALPSTLTAIGSEAFYNCTGLKTVNLLEGLQTINSSVFYNCTGLKTINLPESLQAINHSAFYGCIGLTDIEVPGSVTTISDSAFQGCSGLRSVTINNGTTTINRSVFQNCTGLKEVSLPEGLTKINQSAFTGCSALVSIVLPDSVEYIGYEAFRNCSKLNSVNYPASWKTAGAYNTSYEGWGPDYQGRIFAGCSSLKKITIPEGVTTIPHCAFSNCTYLEEIVLPSTLTAIGSEAFYNCTGLRKVNLVEGLTAIPAYCFYNCTSLGEVVLPPTVVSVGSYAYYNCVGLRTITMNEGLKTIGGYAFYGCDGVLSLVLNEGLETISDRAFSNCDNLKAVELPSSITSFGKDVFDGCSKLTVYCYSGTQAHMVCESEGYRIYLLDEHDHEYITTVETAPTCTRGGSQILTCSICGYYYVDILGALGHDYSSTVVAPTCEEDGYTLHECTRCDDRYQDEIVLAVGHDYGAWVTVADATCTTDGSQKRVCTVCEAEDTQVIPAPGHAYEEVVIPPTCTGQGCTVHTCSVCNDSYGDHFVASLEHSFGEWAVTKAATILECGTRTRSCTVCAKEETEEIAKITVDVENNSQYGVANFTVLDAVSLEPVSGASIFITTEKDGEATLITDEKGQISQILPVGQWPIAVYADGYLVRNVKITVDAGEQDIPPIGISDKPLVDASITTREMTYEEIVEAGIDVESSENKHYYEYKVEIQFHETLDIMSFVSYGDGEGNIISTVSNNTTSQTVHALSHDGNVVEAEPVTIIYSEEYGTYISDRSTLENAVWTPTLGNTIDFVNNGYYFEGYGIPSTLTMTTNRAFPNDGWTYNAQSGRLSMSVGERTHYLTFRDGEFCTVSNSSDSIAISLFERISAEGYPTGTDYVYIPADTFEAGKQYLLVQFKSRSMNNREALSHDADQPAHETATIYGDDVYGEYIVDSALYENAVWLSSTANAGGLKIANNYYFAQVDSGVLQYMPLANETGWNLTGEYLTTTIGDETFYLRYANGQYHVTSSEAYAGKVMIFEKTTATDVISGSGQTDTKTIYRRVYSFEAGKEYIIVGSSKNPSSGGSGGSSSGGYSGSSGGGFEGTLSDGTPVTIYPVSEKFYLIIYGEVSWLKEMFDVEMLILNNSSTDTIENCVAELILPEGLSLAAMVEGEQSAVQTVAHIPENGSHSLHWYVRGDEEGIYNITATLSGTMMPFKEEFFYEYEADSPIKVYAGDAMKMTIYIPEAAYNSADYVVTIELENVSHKVLYGVTHTITGWEQGKITYYSDGKVVSEEYGSGGTLGSMGADAFYPGDKIVIQVSLDILFESSIINNLMGSVDQAEQMYKSYQAVKTAFDLMKGLTSFCSSASSSLDGIIKAGKVTDMEKLKATNSLLSAINKLYGKFEKGDSEAIELANNVQSSEFYKTIKSCADAAGCEAFVIGETAENILELANKIECSISGKGSEEKPFNAFDSLRTMVSNLPIRFVVDQVRVSTIGDSTTTIPHSVVLTPVESPYMGVDNWGKYLYNLTITAIGKIDYVKQVESQIAAYSVHKSSGTKFEAWIERASATSTGIAVCSSGTPDGNFLLETDNETAAYVDGRLTFTGNAILEVTALSAEDGVLYIKDDEGNVKTVVIDVVEAHTCHSDTWKVEIAPSEEYDGYRAKCCDICGDTLAVEVLSACGEHNFGDWIVEQEATEESMGIQYRECQNCYAKEIKYLPIIKELLNMQLVQYGTGMTVTVGGEALANQQAVGIAAGSTFTVASEYDCIVAYSTDSGMTLNRLTGNLISEEENMYQYTLPDTVEQDITLYVILRGDATGDGEVDVFDFYEVLSYLEGTDLAGIFYLASCVTDDDEVDLFDAFATLNYIETGSFGE